MSGWIKLERSLRTDLRFGKAAKKLDLKKILEAAVTSPERYVTLCRTLLLGALSQLWLHADEHIREDDLLRGSLDDINDLIGVEDFCQSLPSDWLVVIDPDHVKVTDFVAHNGTSARSRKLNADRQARYRERHHVSTAHNADVTPSNARNALRQTKQTKQNKRGSTDEDDAAAAAPPPNGSRLPEDWKPTPNLEAYALQLKLDPQKTAENFRDHWIAVPGARGRKSNWTATWRKWCRKDADDRGTLNGHGHRPNNAAAWAEAKTHAEAIGFRQPQPREALGAYSTAIQAFERQPKNIMSAAAAAPKVAALAAKFRSAS